MEVKSKSQILKEDLKLAGYDISASKPQGSIKQAIQGISRTFHPIMSFDELRLIDSDLSSEPIVNEDGKLNTKLFLHFDSKRKMVTNLTARKMLLGQFVHGRLSPDKNKLRELFYDRPIRPLR